MKISLTSFNKPYTRAELITKIRRALRGKPL